MMDDTLKDRLLNALQVSVRHLNSGDDVNSAVAKAASASDFNQEQTHRLCELFNTARTVYHFEHNPDDRSAEFPLADKVAVVKNVFGSQEPDSSKVAELRSYAEYEGRETYAHNGKLATELLPLPVPVEETPNLEAQAQRMWKIINTDRKMAEHCADNARILREKAMRELNGVADELKFAYMSRGIDKYARLIRCYDSDAEYAPVLELLKQGMPKYMDCPEATLKKLGQVIDDTDFGTLKDKMAEARLALEGAANLDAMALNLYKSADDADKQFAVLVEPAAPKPEVDEFNDFFTLAAKTGAATTKREEPDYTLHQLFMGEEPGKTTITKESPDTLRTITDVAGNAADAFGSGLETMVGTQVGDANKKMTESLKNQQREVLLQDLIASDPFISEADPRTVANVYLQIMQVAPEVSLNKEVVRAIIRQGIHSLAISPYDATAWADLEKTIREVQGTLPSRSGSGVEGTKAIAK